MDKGGKVASSSHEEWAGKRVKQAAESCTALSQCPWHFGGAQSISCGTPKPKEGTGLPLGSPLCASCSGQGEELAKQPLARTCCSLPSPALRAGRDGLKRSYSKNKGCLQSLRALSPRGFRSSLWTSYHRGGTSSWRLMQEFFWLWCAIASLLLSKLA